MTTAHDKRRNQNFLELLFADEMTLRLTYAIARTVGCRQVCVMDDNDFFRLIDRSDTEGISARELRQLESSRAVIIGNHLGTDENCHIVVESTATAYEEDAHLAARNAGFLTRFTGQPAHGVVSSWYVDPDAEPAFASGQTLWYEIPARHLGVD